MARGRPSSLYLFGRLGGVTRDRLANAARTAGWRLVRRPGPGVALVAVGHGTAAPALDRAPPVALPAGLPAAVPVVSELGLRRLLGLAGPLPEEHRTLGAADVAAAARLDPAVIACLALYDVLEPVDGRYGYRDLKAAREAARLLRSGHRLGAVVAAAVRLRRAGRTLADTRLSQAPWGEILQEVGGRLGGFDGQLALPLDEAFLGLEAAWQAAEEREADGDLAAAERWYGIAARIDRRDPVPPFNLGNVLDRQGRGAEARLAWLEAVGRDPAFAEAWLNLGVSSESAGRTEQALDAYRRAVAARPDYADAVFTAARFLTEQARYAEALPLWQRYLELAPSGADAVKARRRLALCRLETGVRPAGDGRSGPARSSSP